MKQKNNVYIEAPEGYRVVGYRIPEEGECYMKQTAERNIIIPNAKRTKLFVYPILEKIKPEKPEFKLFKIHNNKGQFVVKYRNGVLIAVRQNIVLDEYTIIGFTDAEPSDFDILKSYVEPYLFNGSEHYNYAVGRKF